MREGTTKTGWVDFWSLPPPILAAAAVAVSDMIRTFEDLPIDILQTLNEYLEFEDVANLWFVGSKRLQTKFANGGVKTLSFGPHVGPWPALISHLRPTELSISSHGRYSNPCGFTAGMDIAGIGPQLRSLDLSTNNGLSALMALLPTTLADLFPSLEYLAFSRQYVPVFSRKEFLRTLPASLTTLYLPYNIGFDVDSLLEMPCQLSQLIFTLYPAVDGDEERIRDATIFTRLTSLNISALDDVDWSKLIPPSVTDYTPSRPFVSLTHNVVAPELFVLTETDLEDEPPGPMRPKLNPTIASLQSYQNLQTLSLPWDTRGSLNDVKSLPRSLTDLYWHYLLGASLDPWEVVKLLPTNITALGTASLSLRNPSNLAHLPKKLKHWPRLQFNLDFDVFSATDKDHTATSDNAKDVQEQISLPRELQTFAVVRATDALVSALPLCATDLDINDSCFSIGGMIQFSSRLTELGSLTIRFSELDAELLQHLPPGLAFLRMDIGFIKNLASLEGKWHHIWSQRLHTLRMSITRDHAPLPASFWTSFPLSLGRLTVHLVQAGSQYPSNLSFLPRRTLDLTLRVAPAQAHKIDNAFFEKPPASLASIELIGFSYSTTHEMFPLLPKRLTSLKLNDATKNAAFRFVPDSTEHLWSFIDQLPPFLHLIRNDISITGWQESFLQRKYDDLVAACPNVAFDHLNPNQDRPFGTPKHRKDHNI